MRRYIRSLFVHYLRFWASSVLRERRPRIVGVTGSVGKTTTKEAIAAVLLQPAAQPLIGLVGKSEGNLNTEIGMPLAILRYDAAPHSTLGWLALGLSVPFRAIALMSLASYPAILVLEYAADRPGDIRRLAALAHPEVAVVTAVGPAHLELFKTVTAVAREKAQLVRAAAPTGLVILARENSHVAAMEDLTHAQVKKVPGRGIELAQGVAQAVGTYFGLPQRIVTEGFKDFHSLQGRLETKRISSWSVIDDTYNANPLSMELALDTLTETAPAESRRVAFLGDMRELGSQSEHYHRLIGEYARSRADLVIAVGDHARAYQGSHWYPTSSAAAHEAADFLRPGDHVLIKGSRGVHMEKIIDALEHRAAAGHPKRID